MTGYLIVGVICFALGMAFLVGLALFLESGRQSELERRAGRG